MKLINKLSVVSGVPQDDISGIINRMALFVHL